MQVHPVINVSHNVPYIERTAEFRVEEVQVPTPILGPEGSELLVKRILYHRRRGRVYQFLVKWDSKPKHEASWEPARNFIDADGTITEQFRFYMLDNGLNDEVVIGRGTQQ